MLVLRWLVVEREAGNIRTTRRLCSSSFAMIVRTTAATVLILAGAAHAHGGHSHGGGENKVDDSAGYIRAHVRFVSRRVTRSVPN